MSVVVSAESGPHGPGFVAFKKGFGLAGKLGATLCCILLFAIGLSTLLNYFNFEKNYGDMVRSRYTVLLKDLGHTVDYGLGLGLGLGAMNNIPELINQAKANDEAIVFIKVFDGVGEVLYDTDPAGVGHRVDDSWRQAAFKPGQALWSLDEPARLLIGLPLRNSFNQLEGSLVLAFSTQELDAAAAHVRMQLLRQSGIVLAVFAGLGLLLCLMLTRRLVGNLRRMQQSLEALLAGRGAGLTEAHADDPLQQEFVDFQRAVAEVQAELQASEQERTPS